MPDDLELLRLRARAKAKASMATEPPMGADYHAGMNFTPDANPISPTEGRLRGFEQQASLGGSDEAAGIGSAVAGFVHPRPGMGRIDSAKQAFDVGRTSELSDLAEAERLRPKEFTEGQLGGGIAAAVGTAPITGAAPVLGTAALGAAQGALEGEGTKNRLMGAGIGGALGLAMGGATKLLSGPSAGAPIADAIERDQVGAGRAALNKASKGGRFNGEEAVSNDIATLKNAGLFKRGSDPEVLRQSTQQILDEADHSLTQAFTALDDSHVKVDTKAIQEKLAAAGADYAQSPKSFSTEIKTLENAISDITGNPDMAPSVLRDQLKVFGEKAFSGQGDPAARRVWGVLKDAVNDMAEKVGGDLGAQISAANQEASAALRLRPLIAKKANAAAAQTFGEHIVAPIFHPLDTGRKLAVKGVEAMASWTSKLMDSQAAKAGRFSKVLQDAHARGPVALAATHYALQQAEPEYRKLTLDSQNEETPDERRLK